MCRTQHVLALLTIYLELVHSWDLALSVGDELRFYTNNTVTSTTRFESQNLTALAYDEVHNMILYVDKQPNGDVICGYSLSSLKHKCFTERTGRSIHGIAFDPVSDKVFFTDTHERTVSWISLKPGSENNARGNLLIKMDEGIPRDIVVDSCKGYVYWLNTDMTKPTIERARFRGAEREVFETITSLPFNETYIFEPHSLAIDQQTQTIHWFEPSKTKYYYMAHSDLDKKDKTLQVAYDQKSFPMFTHPSNTLTVSNDFFFSVDFRRGREKVYIFPKTLNLDTLQSFDMRAGDMINVGIVANYKITEQIQGIENCETLSQIIIAAENDATFCVYGVKVDGESVCECSPGYTGERCDVSVCGNSYCLQGNCSVNSEGLPECRCNAGYSGVRCEINSCHGYCLHDGDCSLNEEEHPVCQCVGSYEGTRCEADKSDTLTNTTFKNMTVADLLSRLQKPASKMFITFEV